MRTPDIMVVPDAGGARAGAVTWWRLSSATDYDNLRVAWEAAGFPANELPAPPSDASALRRALEMFKEDAHTLIRSVPRKQAAFAVVDEEAGEDECLEYEVRFEVWIDYDASAIQFDRDVDDELAEKLVQRFEQERRTLHHGDVSSWLVKRAYAHAVVALRETGGVYFVPETQTERWAAFAKVIESVGVGTVYQVPAMKTDKAVEAIMAAVIAEAGSEVAKLEEELQDIESLGARSLKARAKAVATIGDKLRTYEELLGQKIGDLSQRLQEIDARVVDATFAVGG